MPHLRELKDTKKCEKDVSLIKKFVVHMYLNDPEENKRNYFQLKSKFETKKGETHLRDPDCTCEAHRS